jgi:RNA polymerase sigma factor (sigma-70 family)
VTGGDPASDEELLESWRGGDQRAGDALFSRHFDALYRFFERKTSGDVEDLIQQTLLDCVRARDRFRGEASFRTYLFAIARHQLMGAWRKQKRNPGLDFGVTSLEDLAAGPSQELREKQDRRHLLTALRRLPLDLQIAIELVYWEKLTAREIAEVLEVPEGTVRSRVRRAREALAELLATLGEPGEAIATTLGDLDRWAAEVGAEVGAQAGAENAPPE